MHIVADLAECREHLTTNDIELNRQINAAESDRFRIKEVESENRSLLQQIQSLYAQNQELLLKLLGLLFFFAIRKIPVT